VHHNIVLLRVERQSSTIPFRIDAYESVRLGNREALIQHLFDLHSNPATSIEHHKKKKKKKKRKRTKFESQGALNRKQKF